MKNPLMVKVNTFWSRSLVRRLDLRVVHPWLGEDIEANTSSERQDPSHLTEPLGAADASSTRESYPLAVMPLMISIIRGVEGSAAGESLYPLACGENMQRVASISTALFV